MAEVTVENELTARAEKMTSLALEAVSIYLSQRPREEALLIARGIQSEKLGIRVELETRPFRFRMILVSESGEQILFGELADPSRRPPVIQFPGSDKAN